jgi:hypothetical protein
MQKARYKLGDIFEVHSDREYRYFQFCALDLTQLNSDVVAVFAGIFTESQEPEAVKELPIEFFLHTTVRAGVPDYWERIGTAAPVESSDAVFKDVDGDRDDRQPFEGMSEHWKVWHINEDFQYVGPYEKIPEGAELGWVFSPKNAATRILKGRYEGTYFGVNR